MNNNSFRTVWVSDLHLGNKHAKSDLVMQFLSRIECDTLYLNGDILDLQERRDGWRWNRHCSEFFETLKRLTGKGTRVVFLPGNHDHEFRSFCGEKILGVEIANEVVHTLKDSRRLLVVHGDRFEDAARNNGWMEIVGAWLYDRIMGIDYLCCALRSRFNLPHWSFTKSLKKRLQGVQHYFDRFAHVASQYAKNHDYDGVICGHVHNPEIREIDGVWYCNAGDWVESCSAIVEDTTGELRIVNWRGHEIADTATSQNSPEVAPEFATNTQAK